jgi:hypothetical protein
MRQNEQLRDEVCRLEARLHESRELAEQLWSEVETWQARHAQLAQVMSTWAALNSRVSAD